MSATSRPPRAASQTRAFGSSGYCDDAVVHCASEQQARHVRDAIAGRLSQVGLELHPDKTRIVYCSVS